MDNAEIEINLFLLAVKQVYGYDFTAYARASLRRRIQRLMETMEVDNISSLIPLVFHDVNFGQHAISTLTVSVSELFRNPSVFKALREKVIPYLKTFPAINIWVAGCASGEEAYSIAILCKEEGVLNRTQIYATDICPIALKQAESGILRESLSRKDAQRYQDSSGSSSLSEYFTTQHGFSKLNEQLLSHITFQQHDMINEAAFITPQLLLCRNVLIYFNIELQNNVLDTFYHCLDGAGYLVIGPKENLNLTTQYSNYNVIDKAAMIHKKKVERDTVNA